MASSEYTQCVGHLSQGAALDVAGFMSWFNVRKEGEWLRETGFLRHAWDTPLHCALRYNAPDVVVMAILAAWPDALKEMGGTYSQTPLHYALRYTAQGAVVMALFAAWPDALTAKDSNGITPLHCAMYYNAPEALVVALLAAWPDAEKGKESSGDTLHYALEFKAPEAVVTALLAAWPDAVKAKTGDDETPLHLALLRKAPAAVVTALFAAWPGAIKEKTNVGSTPLHLAMQYNAPEAVAMALFAAWPNAVKEKNNAGEIPLHDAAKHHASDALVRALIASFPGALKEATAITTHPAGGGDTVLHALAAAECCSVAEARNANIICFTLVEKRASLTATNALGQTAAEASQIGKATSPSGDATEPKVNHHLVASFREIAAFKKQKHLSLMHFRDWTSRLARVVHAVRQTDCIDGADGRGDVQT